MGMFDYVRCDMDLPKKYRFKDFYQTKSMECLLDVFIIDPSGRLWIEEYDYNNSDTFPKQPSDYTGEMVFYNSLYDGAYRNKELVAQREYRLKFKDGWVTTIELL